MDFVNDFSAAQDTLLQALISTTRTIAQLVTDDLTFYHSTEPQLGRVLDKQSARLLAISKRVLQSCHSRDFSDYDFADIETIDSNWKLIVDVADDLLERADTALDEFHGLIHRPAFQYVQDEPHHPSLPSHRKGYVFNTHTSTKPQLLFDHITDNDEKPPFRPIMNLKPHAMRPLRQSLSLETDEYGNEYFPHPYHLEISTYDYPHHVYTYADTIPAMPFDGTEATLVTDLDGLFQMLDELRKAPLIAIDLEHHDAHSYRGIVCLMQISTRDHDWIIDTLKPWRRKLEVLNDVFADPNIVKVLHGAFMDILWLQQDFGLYIVGLFDTYHAARVLEYSAGSLAYLLKRFVNFDAQKQYQTADWRIRPLPRDMLEYARSDTHFLLYIFDNVRNDLIYQSDSFDANHEQNRTRIVLERSKNTALQRYENSKYDFDTGLGRYGWFEQLNRGSITLSQEQFSVFREIHQWRDRLARMEDESPHQIMSKYTLMNIVQILPKDVPELMVLLRQVSPSVRLQSHKLLALVQDAKAKSEHGPRMPELLHRVHMKIRSSPSWRLDTSSTSSKSDSRAPDSKNSVETDLGNVRTTMSHLWGSTLDIDDTHLRSSLRPVAIRDSIGSKHSTSSSSLENTGHTPNRQACVVDDDDYIETWKTADNTVRKRKR